AAMLRDLVQGNRAEHEHILGAMIDRGVEKNVPCILLKTAHTHMVAEQTK
ncbi:MAG: hypothetical protein NTW89_03055, partial [Burkholderiales bacterium]|nr:hypothetical protein [Burkholderiales bacterium]